MLYKEGLIKLSNCSCPGRKYTTRPKLFKKMLKRSLIEGQKLMTLTLGTEFKDGIQEEKTKTNMASLIIFGMGHILFMLLGEIMHSTLKT